MATINSNTYLDQTKGFEQMPSPAGYKGALRRAFCSAALPNTLAANDVVNLFKLPKGARIVDVWIYCTDIDTNANPTVTWDVGDADAADTIFAASVAGQSAAYDRSPKIAAINKQYTVDTTIFATCHAAAATKAAGTIYAECIYRIDGLPTS